MVLMFLCCVMAAGCLADDRISPDGMPSNEFLEEVNGSLEYYDALVQSDPENAEAWFIRGMYYNNFYEQYDEAMVSCEKALELDPEYAGAWFLKGVILTNTGKKDEAKGCFDNATKYDISLISLVPT
ncbi:tetratricopeptide repeat protein [Methanogenium organophilum]|uniref:Tetratricopeptide repeat protein n=1 Tax=Methanogenium organophilum TaxID=2199 RepID=A0A9X9T6Z7_METOG|nr:tetratricopeptide repeat protein [Methanogenium organophilum]WAI00220.1 tetratricopeptide repeat protein [Methanogenium organophilum]